MSDKNSIFEKIKFLNEINEEFKRDIKLLYVFRIHSKFHVILVTNEDKVYCCGGDYDGILGFGYVGGRPVDRFTINEDLSNKKIIDFKNGFFHAIARTSDRKLYCWGINRYLGNGKFMEDYEASKPELNEFLKNESIIDMCCGFGHTLVLTSNNEVYAWGYNDFGQIGNKGWLKVIKPFKLDDLNREEVKAISCGLNHSMALTKRGSVYSWGCNQEGQLGLNSSIDKEYKPKRIQINVQIKKICCGRQHSLLLSNKGDIYVFGSNQYNQLGMETNENKQLAPMKLNHSEQFIKIASHYLFDFSAALSKSGFYYVWGKCGDKEIINEMKETQFECFNEIFIHYFGITYEALDISQISLNGRYEREFEKTEETGVLGQGRFGKVYKVFHTKERQYYALKKLKFKDGSSDKIKKDSLREIEIMESLRSDYVVHYIRSWIENENEFYIQMELCYKALNEVLQLLLKEFGRKQFETMSLIKYYISSELFKETVEALNYLHERNPPIIHRDLKPSNILISHGSNGRFVKLGDFGISVIHAYKDQPHTQGSGTVQYMAPEVQHGREYDTKADVYSLGLISRQLFNINLSPNTSTDNILIADKYKNAKSLIEKMISLDVQKRPNCQQILISEKLWYLNIENLNNDSIYKNITKSKVDHLIKVCFHEYFIRKKHQLKFDV